MFRLYFVYCDMISVCVNVVMYQSCGPVYIPLIFPGWIGYVLLELPGREPPEGF